LEDYDLIIFTSSIEFSINGDQELKLVNFISDRDHSLLVFTPFVDQFGGDLRDDLGMDSINEILPQEDGEFADWTVSLNKKVGNDTVGQTYEYSGKLGIVDLNSGVQTIASAISSDSSDEDILNLDFPIPIIFNVTTNEAKTIVSTSSIIDTSDEFLKLSQIPDFFTVLISDLINYTFNIHRNENPFQTNPTGTDSETITDTQHTETAKNENNDISLPLDISFPLEYMFYLLILMGLIFIRKIFSFISWFGEKAIDLGVFIVGAFYNVQDRILDANDVFLNQSRVELLDYLEYIGEYGSHIRELKSLTKMGTGSLLWHLQVLEDFYFIYKFKINRNTIFVASDFVDDFDTKYKEIEMDIQSKYSQILIEELFILKNQNEISVSELEELTSVNNRTIRRFLSKLNDYEIVSYIQTSPIIITIANKDMLQRLNKSYELRADYSYTRTEVDVQSL
jgi:predicted transcriptional regulator